MDIDRRPLMLIDAARETLERILPADGSMKALLVDSATLAIISTIYSQTFLLDRGVFVVDLVGSETRGPVSFLRGIIFVRPTPQSLRLVSAELANPKYPRYAMYFSHAVTSESLNAVAAADVKETVAEVGECFCDGVMINSDLCIAPGAAGSIPRFSGSVTSPDDVSRLAQGVTSMCLMLKRKPRIRVQNTSPFARKLCSDILGLMGAETELFDLNHRETLLLVLDRADDPITPLLTPWTYQAMLHEYAGLHNNTVTLPGQKAEEGFVFSQAQDTFFSNNMCSNWGDLCLNLKTFVDEYKQVMNIDKETASLEDLKQIMANLGQTKAMSTAVQKHVTVISQIGETIKKRHLMDIGLLEQHIIADTNPTEHWQRLQQFAADASVDRHDVLRLCLLYSLKYEKPGQPRRTLELLTRDSDKEAVNKFRQYYGADKAPTALFPNTGIVSTVLSLIKTMPDVQSVYTQHEPLLKSLLTQVASSKLPADVYPYVSAPPPPVGWRPREVIVVIAGGGTFEEAALVHSINQSKSSTAASGAATSGPAAPTPLTDMKVYLASHHMWNTRDFIDQLRELP